MSRPGSGNIWNNFLTSPKAPILRSHSRSLIKSSQKLKLNLMKGAAQEQLKLSRSLKSSRR